MTAPLLRVEQDIVRAGHRCSVADLHRLGRHVERAVLARAVGWHREGDELPHVEIAR